MNIALDCRSNDQEIIKRHHYISLRNRFVPLLLGGFGGYRLFRHFWSCLRSPKIKFLSDNLRNDENSNSVFFPSINATIEH